MVEFTKKLIYVGNSRGVTFPPEILEMLDLQTGDFVTLKIMRVKKNDRTL